MRKKAKKIFGKFPHPCKKDQKIEKEEEEAFWKKFHRLLGSHWVEEQLTCTGLGRERTLGDQGLTLVRQLQRLHHHLGAVRSFRDHQRCQGCLRVLQGGRQEAQEFLQLHRGANGTLHAIKGRWDCAASFSEEVGHVLLRPGGTKTTAGLGTADRAGANFL